MSPSRSRRWEGLTPSWVERQHHGLVPHLELERSVELSPLPEWKRQTKD